MGQDILVIDKPRKDTGLYLPWIHILFGYIVL